MLKLAISATLVTSPFLHCFEQFGWHTVDGSVQTTWDNNEECMEEETYSSSEEESDEEGRSDIEDSASQSSEIPHVEEVDLQHEDSDGAL